MDETSAPTWQTLKGVTPGQRIGFTEGTPAWDPKVAPVACKTIAALEVGKGGRTVTFTDGTSKWGGVATKYWVAPAEAVARSRYAALTEPQKRLVHAAQLMRDAALYVNEYADAAGQEFLAHSAYDSAMAGVRSILVALFGEEVGDFVEDWAVETGESLRYGLAQWELEHGAPAPLTNTPADYYSRPRVDYGD